MKSLVVLLAFAVSATGFSQVLSGAASPNNGTGGIYMDFTPTSQNLMITEFDTFFGATTPTAFTVEIWTRPGSYVGFDTSSAGWTLWDTVNGNSVDNVTAAQVLMNNAISLTATQTTGVLLHSTTVGNGVRYNGTSAAPPNTLWFNSDLTMFSDRSHTGNVPFAGNAFSPRTFAGDVHYSAVPEPATMSVLALGALALMRRRRRKA